MVGNERRLWECWAANLTLTTVVLCVLHSALSQETTPPHTPIEAYLDNNRANSGHLSSLDLGGQLGTDQEQVYRGEKFQAREPYQTLHGSVNTIHTRVGRDTDRLRSRPTN